MDVLLNGKYQLIYDLRPDMTVKQFKDEIRRLLVLNNVEHKIEVFFSDDQQLSPLVMETNNYDNVNFEAKRNILRGGSIRIWTYPIPTPGIILPDRPVVNQPTFQPLVLDPVRTRTIMQELETAIQTHQEGLTRPPQIPYQLSPQIPYQLSPQIPYQLPPQIPYQLPPQMPQQPRPNFFAIRNSINHELRETGYEDNVLFPDNLELPNAIIFAAVRLYQEDMVDINQNIIKLLNRINLSPQLQALNTQITFGTPKNFIGDDDDEFKRFVRLREDEFEHEMFLWIYQHKY